MSKFKHYLEMVQDEDEDEVDLYTMAGSDIRRPWTLSSGVIFDMKEKGDTLKNRTFGIKVNGKPHFFTVEKVTVGNLKKAFLKFIKTTVKDQGLVEKVQNQIKNYPNRWYFDFFPDLAKFKNLELS